MGAIRFFLFGKLRIETSARELQKVEPRKAEELLGYLLLNRDKTHSRERLADALWGEISQDQTSNYLRKALWQLQSVLETITTRNNRLLLVDGERIQINPHFELWLDVAIIEHAFKQTQGILGRDLVNEQVQTIERAVDLYRGELLDGCYQDWCLYDRERLQHLYLALLDKLMDYCEMYGAYEKGLALGEIILHYDPARERTHRRLMRLYYMAGDRTAALRQYQRCAAILKEELDVEPGKDTRSIHEMIRADQLENLNQPSQNERGRIDHDKREPLRVILNDLGVFQKELSQIQKQLTKDMKVIQQTLNEDHS